MSLDRARRRFHEWWREATWETCGAPPPNMSREIKSAAHGKTCPVAFCNQVMEHREGQGFGHERPEAATVDHRLPQSLGGVNEKWCLLAICNDCNRILGQILNERYFQVYGGVIDVPFRKLKKYVDFQYKISSKSFNEEEFSDLTEWFKTKKKRSSQSFLNESEVGESRSLVGSLVSEARDMVEEVIS